MPVITGKLKKQDELRINKADIFTLLVAPLGVNINENLTYEWDAAADQLVIRRQSTEVDQPINVP